MHMMRALQVGALALAVAVATGATTVRAAEPSLTIGMAGVPPIFVNVQNYVAAKQQLFDKFGVKVTLRTFDSGAAAARAVVAGDIDAAMSPTPLDVNMISNAKVDLVAIYGYEHPDFLIGSIDPSVTKCDQLKGLPVGVDAIGGARSIALSQMLRACNMKATDMQQVALSSNVGQAMISGQLKVAVLHIDDVPVIESKSHKKVIPIVHFNDVVKNAHYMSIVTTRKKLSADRNAFVRYVAALVEAQRFMSNPKNLDQAAADASVTGRSADEAKWSLQHYIPMDFWPKDSGLSKARIDQTIKAQVAVHGIRPGVTPVTYAKYADESVYNDALKMLK